MIERIGMQLFTLRDLLQSPEDIEKTFPELRKIGYRAVQVSGIKGIEPKHLKEIADKNELKIVATHISYDRLTNELDKVIDEHKLWGCQQIAVPSMPEKFRDNANGSGYIEFAKEMSELGAKLFEDGITLSYHNHAFEFQKFGDKTGLELIYENSDPKFFQAELDTYWVQYGGGDVRFWCEKLSNRLPLLHAKDYGIVNNTPTFMEVGQGNLNWKGILEICKQADVKWYLVEQDVCQGNPLDSAKISYDNLKNLLS